jgi:hypothetical protein
MLRFSLLMLEADMRTSFHHQSEAQHPKSSAIHKCAGRLPHLMTPNVWTGRASQEAFGDGEVGLALMYPASLWSFCSGP